jgi:hypothetical protein
LQIHSLEHIPFAEELHGMAISDFLKARENDSTRERMYFHWLAHQLQLEAAETGHLGYYLEIFEPEVDRSGFDIVLNDADWERHIQVKTVLTSSTTDFWEIRTKLLLPIHSIVDVFGLEPMSSGLGGGFLLLEIADQSGQVKSYSYTDYFTLVAQALNLTENSDSAARTVLDSLNKPNPERHVTIRRSVLMPLKRIPQILGVIGLHNTGEVSLLPHYVTKAVTEPKGESVWKIKLREILFTLTT